MCWLTVGCWILSRAAARVKLALLAAMGLANLAFQSMANASVQIAVDSRLRGRVMGLYMLTFIGGTPIGAPLIGTLTSHFGARTGMTACGVIPVLAAAVVATARRGRTDPSAAPECECPRRDELTR